MAAGANYNLIGAGGFTGGVLTGVVTGVNGTAGAPGYGFPVAGYGMYADATHLYFAANGVQALAFDASQNATFGSGAVTMPGTVRTYGPNYVNYNNTTGYLAFGIEAASPTIIRVGVGKYQMQDFSTGTKPAYILQGNLNVSKTANYTLVFADMDVHFDTTGAAGSVAFTLPTPQAGFRAFFCATAAQVMTVVTPSGSIFAPGSLSGATRTVTATTAANQYTSFCVECKDGTNYVVTCLQGTMT